MSTPDIDKIVNRVLGGEIDAYEGIVRAYQRFKGRNCAGKSA